MSTSECIFPLVSSISAIYPECLVWEPESSGSSSVTWALFIALWTQAKEWSRWLCVEWKKNQKKNHEFSLLTGIRPSEIDRVRIFGLQPFHHYLRLNRAYIYFCGRKWIFFIHWQSRPLVSNSTQHATRRISLLTSESTWRVNGSSNWLELSRAVDFWWPLQSVHGKDFAGLDPTSCAEWKCTPYASEMFLFKRFASYENIFGRTHKIKKPFRQMQTVKEEHSVCHYWWETSVCISIYWKVH